MLDKIPNVILVGTGGIFGAISRYGIGLLVQQSEFPFGTLLANIIGSILLGLLMGLVDSQDIDPSWILLLGVGFMGSLTTMSTFAVETINSGSLKLALLNIVVTLVGVLLGALIGQFTGTILGN